MTRAQAFAKAAVACEGARFRLYGRDPATGLDCVGLVAHALSCVRGEVQVPAGYRLRNAGIACWTSFAEKNGLAAVHRPARCGNILLAMVGAAQHHLFVALGTRGFVHAHAGLRRVIVQSAPPVDRIEAQWHLPN